MAIVRNSLAFDCLGHIVSFLDSPRTFFTVLSISSSTYDYFHDYGSESCRNVEFRIGQNPIYRTAKRLNKPYILKVVLGSFLHPLVGDVDSFSWFSYFVSLQDFRFAANPEFDLANLKLLRCCECLHSLHIDFPRGLHQRGIPLSDIPDGGLEIDLSWLDGGAFPKLRKFCLDSRYVRRGRPSYVVLPEHMRLTNAVFRKIGLKESSFGFLQFPDYIEEIELDGNNVSLPPLFGALPGLTNLKTLSIRSKRLQEFPFASLPKSLTKLVLRNDLDENTSLSFSHEDARALPAGLNHLAITAVEVEDENILASLSCSQQLKTLEIGRNWRLLRKDSSSTSEEGEGVLILSGIKRFAASLESLGVGKVMFDLAAIEFAKLKELRLPTTTIESFVSVHVFRNLQAFYLSNSPDPERIVTEMVKTLEDDCLLLRETEVWNTRFLNLSQFLRVLNPIRLRKLTVYAIFDKTGDLLRICDEDMEKFVGLEILYLGSIFGNLTGSFVSKLRSVRTVALYGQSGKKEPLGDQFVFPMEELPLSIESLKLNFISARFCPNCLVLPNHQDLRVVDLWQNSGDPVQVCELFLPHVNSLSLGGFNLSEIQLRSEMLGENLEELRLRSATTAAQVRHIRKFWPRSRLHYHSAQWGKKKKCSVQ